MHDARCNDLARVFLLHQNKAYGSKEVDDLAESIQKGIEDWLEAWDVYQLPKLKCDGAHAGPRCADPECWNQ